MRSLRIIKRNERFVVQIGKKKLFRNKLKWIDMIKHFIELNKHANLPLANTSFSTQEEAESFCENYLTVKRKPEDHEVKTYNTGLHDMVWERPTPMPKCKPLKVERDNQ